MAAGTGAILAGMTLSPDSLAAVRAADAFSQSYAEARAKFRSVAAVAGAELPEHAHPLKGPAGEDLACDVARRPSPCCSRMRSIRTALPGSAG